jgi:hypothetical protein
MTRLETTDRGAVRAEVLAFFGPHAKRRVFRGAKWTDIKSAERKEEQYPGSTMTDFIDLIEETKLAYARKWTVDDVVEAVSCLRARGYRNIRLNHDGSIDVRVRRDEDPEPNGRPWGFHPVAVRLELCENTAHLDRIAEAWWDDLPEGRRP